MVPNFCLEGITYFVKNNISPGEVPCFVWSGEWPEGVVFLYGLENGQKGLVFLHGLQTIQKHQSLLAILQTIRNKEPLPEKYYFLRNK